MEGNKLRYGVQDRVMFLLTLTGVKVRIWVRGGRIRLGLGRGRVGVGVREI